MSRHYCLHVSHTNEYKSDNAKWLIEEKNPTSDNACVIMLFYKYQLFF